MGLQFRKVIISAERFESAGVFDVNGDGIPDIVSGEFWYEGPHFKKQYRLCHLASHGDYFDDFCTIPMDINGNGRMDFITGGWWGKTLRWRGNPGEPGADRPEHVITEAGPHEADRASDVGGGRALEVVSKSPA